MEQKKNEQRTAQILYITIIMVMLIMALAVGLVTMANRRNAPSVTTDMPQSMQSTSIPDKDHTSPSVTTAPRVTTTPRVTQPYTTPAVTTSHTPVINVEEPVAVAPEFIMPTIGNVSKTFSIDVLVYSNTMEDYRTHNGIDICATLGDAVMAAADGIVTEIYEDPMMGCTVVISHDGDMKTVYQNLADEITVDIGNNVKSGEVIGAVGESAIIEIAEEPHLHFEMMLSGERVDPLEFISDAAMTIVYDE
ncbi:MAG: peptidoglycan DD-metalloendopeptidase family protein [Clostridia bacterium]|nr:peptidoglycan DD-metalloendopeptidase family protein [Clostridia bacterium]